jgi:hypothetical protein
MVDAVDDRTFDIAVIGSERPVPTGAHRAG